MQQKKPNHVFFLEPKDVKGYTDAAENFLIKLTSGQVEASLSFGTKEVFFVQTILVVLKQSWVIKFVTVSDNPDVVTSGGRTLEIKLDEKNKKVVKLTIINNNKETCIARLSKTEVDRLCDAFKKL